jgi:hypothetical protein
MVDGTVALGGSRRRPPDHPHHRWADSCDRRHAAAPISRHLAETMKRLSGVDLVISTEDRKPEEVAAELEVAVRERTGSGEISATRRRPTG